MVLRIGGSNGSEIPFQFTEPRRQDPYDGCPRAMLEDLDEESPPKLGASRQGRVSPESRVAYYGDPVEELEQQEELEREQEEELQVRVMEAEQVPEFTRKRKEEHVPTSRILRAQAQVHRISAKESNGSELPNPGH